MLKALADETRIRILSIILEGDLCVCEIEDCLGLTQSNASRHLNTLKKAGILDSYKMAQWTYYKVNEQFIKNNEALYHYLTHAIKEIPSYEKDYESYKKCKGKNMCGCNKE